MLHMHCADILRSRKEGEVRPANVESEEGDSNNSREDDSATALFRIRIPRHSRQLQPRNYDAPPERPPCYSYGFLRLS